MKTIWFFNLGNGNLIAATDSIGWYLQSIGLKPYRSTMLNQPLPGWQPVGSGMWLYRQ